MHRLTTAVTTATEITRKGYFYKNTWIYRSIFASYGTHARIILHLLRIFMRQGRGTRDAGRRGNKITDIV